MEISRSPDLWQLSCPWQQLQLWHNLMLQSSGEKKKALEHSVPSGCPLSAVFYSEGFCCIPRIRSPGLNSAALTVTGVASEKSHHPFITKSAAFLAQGLWMTSSKKLAIGVQCILKRAILYDGRTSIALVFLEAFVLWGCLYTFVSLWDTGPWKSWRGRNMHSVCQ